MRGKLVKTASASHYFLEPLAKTDIFCSAVLPSLPRVQGCFLLLFVTPTRRRLSFNQLQNLCSYILCICEPLSCWTSSDTHQIEIIQPNSTLPSFFPPSLLCACQDLIERACQTSFVCIAVHNWLHLCGWTQDLNNATLVTRCVSCCCLDVSGYRNSR